MVSQTSVTNLVKMLPVTIRSNQVKRSDENLVRKAAAQQGPKVNKGTAKQQIKKIICIFEFY